MEIKNQLKTILSKRMDRKDFIKHVAFGAVALIGGSFLVRMASLNADGDNASPAPVLAYGKGSAYGGDKRTSADSRKRRTA